MQHSAIYILLTFIATVPALQAQESLNWEELQAMAAGSNRSIKRAKVDTEIAAQNINGSEAGYYPNLHATASHQRSIDPRPIGVADSNRVTLTASQNLFAGLGDHASIQSRHANRDFKMSQEELVSIEQRSELRKAYDRALYLQEALIFAKKTLERRGQNVRIVALRYEGGRENKSSLLKTEAAHLQAAADLKFYETNRKVTALQIKRLCSCNLSDSVVFTPSPTRSETAPIQYKDHPKYKAALSQTSSLRHNVDSARAGWLPQLTADANVSRYGEDLRLEPDNHVSLGLTLTVPLFDAAQSPRYREAAQSLAAGEIDAVIAAEDISVQQADSKARYEAALAQAHVGQKVSDATKLQAEVYRQRYTLGMISFQDWDSVEAEYIKSEKDLLLAKLDLENSLTDLEFANGKRLEDKN